MQVSVLAPNTPALYEMHFAVPMAGAVLNAINTRLDAPNVAAIIKHAEPKVLFVDYQYITVATKALQQSVSMDMGDHRRTMPLLVVIDDIEKPTGVTVPAPSGEGDGHHQLPVLEYEQLVARGDTARHPPRPVEDKWDAVALNYTSGTTSAPKGVVYSHRGAYLSTLALLLQWGVGHEPSTCGRLQCSTATGGCSHGAWRRAAAPTSASARPPPRLCTPPSPPTALPRCSSTSS